MGFIMTSAVIQVDMSVTRYRTFPEDGIVEVWGYVGDYEVCVHLPIADAQTRVFVSEESPKKRRTDARLCPTIDISAVM